MPKSKHRRKSSKKATRNPGREKTPRWSITRELECFKIFHQRYRDSIPQYLDDECVAFLIDLIAEEAFHFRADKVTLKPFSKDRLFGEYLTPLGGFEDDEDEIPINTFETAEAAISILLEHNMIEVDGDVITVPDRFCL